jgi:hypothetical protein
MRKIVAKRKRKNLVKERISCAIFPKEMMKKAKLTT